MTPSPIVLLILDGWGIAPKGPGNAISLAHTPNLDRFTQAFPHTQLLASGESVGLPKNEAGNTEVGHLNLGAGSIVYQDLPRINHSIADGSFFQNDRFLQAITHTKNFKSHLHLMGLVGSGGVHASNEHLFALLRLAKTHKLAKVYLHLFTDGRDSPPKSAVSFIAQVQDQLQKINLGHIASLSGRYYAMDRDSRWDRTQKAYLALTQNQGPTAPSALDAVTQAYAQNHTDEFIPPTLILDKNGKPYPPIRDNDAVVFFNFRIDRPRQLTKAFVLPNFKDQSQISGFDPYAVKYHHKHQSPQSQRKPFTRQTRLTNLFFVTMTEYEKGLPVSVAFPPQPIANPLGRIISDHRLAQLHMAETEKERFVTYYFNGLREDPFPKEDRIIIPSPQVKTYDLKPQMSAPELTQTLLERLSSQKYHFIVVNLANADMVGHTGNIAATIKACEAIDQSVGQIVLNVLGLNGTVLITADHGNAEEMLTDQNQTNTEHSTNPVPFILVSNQLKNQTFKTDSGILADVAPTILKLLKAPQPQSMTGRSLT